MDLRPRKKIKQDLEITHSSEFIRSEQGAAGQASNTRTQLPPPKVLPFASPASTVTGKRTVSARSPSNSTIETDFSTDHSLTKHSRFASPETTPEATRYSFRRRSTVVPVQQAPSSLSEKSLGKRPMPKPSRTREPREKKSEQLSSSTRKRDNNNKSGAKNRSKDLTLVPPGSSKDISGSSSSRRSTKGRTAAKMDEVDHLRRSEEEEHPDSQLDVEEEEEEDDHDEERRNYDEEDEEEDDMSDLRRAGAFAGIPLTTMQRLARFGGIPGMSGMMSGIPSQLKQILPNLRQRDDPTIQLIALQELAEVLSISTEDNLSGYMSPEPYVKELVFLMRGSESPFGENPEVMLLACRCLANLMEAMPSAMPTVVYGGAVPVLCQKLLEIQFIDVAEQALSTLEKISVEYPTSIVREGGLGACLLYLDFFSTHVQRTAVTTAANCCRSIPLDSFQTVKDVMPNIQQTIRGSDQKVVEQGCLCIARIVESFRSHPEKLEHLVTSDVLEAVLGILMPGNTSLVGPSTVTSLLKLLGLLARASPELSVQMLKMNLVDNLYQILTGVSPADGLTDPESRKKSNIFVLQALIHRPHHQILETLGIIQEIFPCVDPDEEEGLPFPSSLRTMRKTDKESRAKVLEGAQDEVSRFAKILVPTLIEIFGSTIIYGIRQRVITALLRIFVYMKADILKEVLTDVQLSSFLAAVLSQMDNPHLVLGALQLAELLASKLPEVYRMHFQREGIIAEVEKIAKNADDPPAEPPIEVTGIPPVTDEDSNESDDEERHPDSEDDDSADSPESSYVALPVIASSRDRIAKVANEFLMHYRQRGSEEEMAESKVMTNLRELGEKLEIDLYEDSSPEKIFRDLARYFRGGEQDAVTTFELLSSNILDVLLKTLSTRDEKTDLQRSFLNAFCVPCSEGEKSTPLEVLIGKLQELLSRAERFEVLTVNGHSQYDDHRRNPATTLARQIRLKVVAEDPNSIPKECRVFQVTIHAVAPIDMLHKWLKGKIISGMNSKPVAVARSTGRMSFGALGIPEAFRDLVEASGTLEAAAGGIGSSSRGTESKNHGRRRRRSSRISKLEHQSEETLDTAVEDHHGSSELDEMDDEIVDDLDDDLDDDMEPDVPVNVDVSGIKLPRHKTTKSDEISTQQIPSPLHSQNSSQGSQGSAPITRVPPMSYAAAVQSLTDWHLEFEHAGHKIPFSSTVYEPIHRFSGLLNTQHGIHNLFQQMHTFRYKKVSGPIPPQDVLPPEYDDILIDETAVVSKDDKSTSILKLLKLLHSLWSDWQAILTDTDKDAASILNNLDLVSQFVNTKLTAKLNRQLEEPFLVASNCLPIWSRDLARHYPFLFPFETRYLFVQSTSFGYPRSMTRWQAERSNHVRLHDRRDAPLGKLQRTKLRLQSRDHFFQSAMQAMTKYGASASLLEFEYENEVGTGLGPTLEFYANASKEFAKKDLKMWRANDSLAEGEYSFVANGLFPAPLPEKLDKESSKSIAVFKILGIFIARAMLDSRIIDINLNPLFFRLALAFDGMKPSLAMIKQVDGALASSLALVHKFLLAREAVLRDSRYTKQGKKEQLKAIRIDDSDLGSLALSFTVPGYDEIELKPNGKNIDVTMENVGEYFDLVLDFTLGKGIVRQICQFREGFSTVFPFTALQAFTPDELVMVCGKSEEDWTYEMLADSIKADHGFNIDSKSIRNILEILSELNKDDRRTFLQFLTGSPKLPIGGFKKLLPPFTIVCRPNEPPLTADDYLPSVMTCANYLKLPDYSTKEIMRTKIFTAMKEGSQSFHLS